MTISVGAPASSAHEIADWLICSGCREIIYGRRFVRLLHTCPKCGHHGRLSAEQRIEQLFDAGTVRPIAPSAAPPDDPLGFTDVVPYARRLAEARHKTAADEAVRCVAGEIMGIPAVAAVMDFQFLGGSLGAAAGELITGAAETALSERLPFVLVTASGGARMQEGALSLMQMAKTSQALAALDDAGVPTISIITDPTYGGVAASFATLTDLIIAEPGARMGFAGPRVIEQTVRQRLPEGFQTAEFLLRHGLVDGVVPRGQIRMVLRRLLVVHRPPNGFTRSVPPSPVIRDPNLLPPQDPWETVQLARDRRRPTTLDYFHYMLDGFLELHGDRSSGDCPAIVGGIGRLAGVPVMAIGHQKGHDTQELVDRKFGMASPNGHRKAARLMRLAEKLRLPIVTLIDTPGAAPGIEAEEHGQAITIAENLRLMSRLTVPIVAVVTGEGGSGGALALGIANCVLVLENGIYSVISPEGCAAILWRSAAAASEAAAALRLDARELLRHGIVDGVIGEPAGGVQNDHHAASVALADSLLATLAELIPLAPGELVRRRHARFRRYGVGTDTRQS
jgi:acyl-CoA carboxylase subunit beta